MEHTKGGFTMPGEAGYEKLTLELAERWGADVVRDSDGTKLSDEIINAGYGVYSTICIIREHNDFGRAHPECLQQTFLSTDPQIAGEGALRIDLIAGFFAEQFKVNDSEASMTRWQVWDRTEGRVLDRGEWSYEKGVVTVERPEAYHAYTASFMAYRLWEEINMYNHVTNSWTSEHLMPIDPRLPVAREYLYDYFDRWCREHPDTTVVRFTSMFYNFVWIWGSHERNRTLFSDWGSYDFTVSEKALEDFEKEYGYALTAEDFINHGDLQVTHMPPTEHKRDYMEFTQKYVASFGRELVELAHKYGKKAYVFYDDSWVGVEPYGPHFKEFGFDGIIKCVFSGYEARLCAGVPARTHELRLHPYLFPVGLGGAPTFMEGGDPTGEAKRYWINVRRALLRAKIDRIGLGGYIHLLQGFPDFVDYIAEISDEFRAIKALHEEGAPYVLPLKVAVMHSWGALRPWTLSGHFHETYMHDLIHIDEALSGLPVEVRFIDFDDAKAGALEGVDVLINAGRAGTAWSGGDVWKDADLVAAVTKWVHEGGVFVGVGEPSAAPGGWGYFKLREVLGVDEDTGARVCHGRYTFDVEAVPGLIPEGAGVRGLKELYLTDDKTRVLAAEDGLPTITAHKLGRGCGVYMSSFQVRPENTRMLLNLMLWASGRGLEQSWLTDTPAAECAYFPKSGEMVVINNSDEARTVKISAPGGERTVELGPCGIAIEKE